MMQSLFLIVRTPDSFLSFFSDFFFPLSPIVVCLRCLRELGVCGWRGGEPIQSGLGESDRVNIKRPKNHPGTIRWRAGNQEPHGAVGY